MVAGHRQSLLKLCSRRPGDGADGSTLPLGLSGRAGQMTRLLPEPASFQRLTEVSADHARPAVVGPRSNSPGFKPATGGSPSPYSAFICSAVTTSPASRPSIRPSRSRPTAGHFTFAGRWPAAETYS